MRPSPNRLAVMNPSLRLSALAGLLSGSVLLAANWPFVRGPQGDGTSKETLPAAWPASGPKVLWRVPSENGFSSFTVADGKAFTLELREVEGAKQEVLVARNADTGAELWFKPLGSVKYTGGGDSGTAENKGGDGPRSTPTWHEGKVFVTSAKLVLTCFDAKTGSVIWQKDLMKDFGAKNIAWENAASPLIEGGLVLVAGGGAGQSLVAFKAKTGEVAWKGFDETMTHATSTPATIHGQRQVVFFLKSGLLSVDPKSGKELWRYAFPFRISTAASPVVSGDVVYCSAGYGVGAGACRVSKKDGVWSTEEIYRFQGDKPLANHWSTPVLHEGHLYGMFQFKEYGSGPVKCVEFATGKVKWEKGGFGPGQVILVGKKVLALGDAGQLVIIEPTPEGYKELARADVLDGKCWGSPVVSNGRVYARSTKEAVCIDLGAK